MNKLCTPNFCILPWVHLSTRPSGRARVCCSAELDRDVTKLNFVENDIFGVWNSEYMKDIRVKMLKNEQPELCKKCFDKEASGHITQRIWETRLFNKIIDIDGLIRETKEDGSVPDKIYYFDLRFGNECNLKCLMCSPKDSSMWNEDWKKLKKMITRKALKDSYVWLYSGKDDPLSNEWFKDNERFFSQLKSQIPYIKKLYLCGGEPLLVKENNRLLDTIIEMGYAKDIILKYNTNGILLQDEVIKKWEQFKRVTVNISIDGYEKINDYIRYPSRWSSILKSLEKLDDTGDNIMASISCAIQIPNVYYIPDLIKWKLSMNYKKVGVVSDIISFNFVYNPTHLNIRSLPYEFKLKVKDKFEEFYIWFETNFKNYTESKLGSLWLKQLKSIPTFMMSEDWSSYPYMDDFREYINIMDKIRGTDFKKTFPEIKDLLDV